MSAAKPRWQALSPHDFNAASATYLAVLKNDPELSRLLDDDVSRRLDERIAAEATVEAEHVTPKRARFSLRNLRSPR